MRLHRILTSDAVGALKNTAWALPYLAVMGMIWGYLAGAASGLIIGLLIAALASAIVGTASTICGRRPAGGTAHLGYDPAEHTAGTNKTR